MAEFCTTTPVPCGKPCMIIDSNSGKPLTVLGGKYNKGDAVTISDLKEGDASQLFEFQPDGHIYHVASGKAIALDKLLPDNGTVVQLWNPFNIPSQKWTVNEKGNITSHVVDKSVDVDEFGKENGTKVQLWRRFDDQENQQFKFVPQDYTVLLPLEDTHLAADDADAHGNDEVLMVKAGGYGLIRFNLPKDVESGSPLTLAIKVKSAGEGETRSVNLHHILRYQKDLTDLTWESTSGSDGYTEVKGLINESKTFDLSEADHDSWICCDFGGLQDVDLKWGFVYIMFDVPEDGSTVEFYAKEYGDGENMPKLILSHKV